MTDTEYDLLHARMELSRVSSKIIMLKSDIKRLVGSSYKAQRNKLKAELIPLTEAYAQLQNDICRLKALRKIELESSRAEYTTPDWVKVIRFKEV